MKLRVKMLEAEIGRLRRSLSLLRSRTSRAFTTCNEIAYQHKYYKKHRGSQDRIRHRLYARLLRLEKQVTRLPGVKFQVRKGVGVTFFPRLTSNEFKKLLLLLGENHNRCIRPPKGRTIPYLKPYEVARMRRLVRRPYGRK